MGVFERVKVWHRLTAAGLVLCVPLGMVIYFLVEEQNVAIAFTRKEIIGVEQIVPLRRLVDHLQRHRGLAQRALSGDRTVELAMEQEATLLKRSFADIARVAERRADALGTAESRQALHERWKALREDWRGLEPDEAWVRHSALVEDGLALIRHIGNASNLITDPALDSYYLMIVVVERIPIMAEMLGQLRGLGAGAAAAGRLDGTARDRLLVSFTHLLTGNRRLRYDLGIALDTNPALLRNMEQSFDELQERYGAFLETTETRLLYPRRDGKIDLDPGVYFDQATTVIEAVYVFFDTAAPALVGVLGNRIAWIERNRYVVLAATLAAFLAAVAVGMQLVRTVTRPLTHAVAVFKSIGEGRYDNEINMATGGEPLALLSSLAAMQQRIGTTITECGRLEKRLRDSENKYRDLVDGSIEGIFIHHGGRVVYANQSAADIFGYPLDELIGLSPPEKLLHVDEAERIREFRQQLRLEAFEFRGLRRDRTVVQLQALVRKIDWEGEPAFQATVQDVTARKQAQAQLYQAQKMEAVGQLTGGIAHDFNNHLTIIMGNLELLMEKLEGDTARRKLIASAFAAARRGANLIQHLLAFSRRQILDPEPTDINSVVSGILDFIALATASNVTVETRLSESLWSAMVDAGQLENALINLAINARDAMPDGGSLIIETANVSVDDALMEMHAYMKPGNFVAVTIGDSGGGMTKEVIEQAFDPFFTTKAVGKGSGLGLSMIYGFIKQTGGYVTIDSEPGHGTTIRLYLPSDFQASVSERGLLSA